MKSRLYIAIDLDPTTKDELEKNANLLRAHSFSGSYTNREFFHLTLHFLGNTDELFIPEIIKALQEIKVSSFEITLSSFNAFIKDSSIIYRSVEKTLPLMKIQNDLSIALMNHQIPFHNRDYIPHITLLKKAVFDNAIPFVPSYTCHIHSISLCESSWRNNVCHVNKIFTLEF